MIAAGGSAGHLGWVKPSDSHFIGKVTYLIDPQLGVLAARPAGLYPWLSRWDLHQGVFLLGQYKHRIEENCEYLCAAQIY